MADDTPEDADRSAEAARAAGWDPRFGTAPNEHGTPVEGLETSETPPAVT